LTLDKSSPQPLYLQLEELIRTWIESGKRQPGDRIPSELELASTHDISRTTARRAIETLVMEGLLFRQPGKGTFVAEPKMAWPGPTSLSFSTTMRALGLSVQTRVLDLRLVPATPQLADELGLSPPEQVIFLRRLRSVENEPMGIHTSYITPEPFMPLLERDLTSQPLNQVMEEVSGLHIVGSCDYVEAALARPDEAKLLGIRTGAPLLFLRGVVYAEGQVPVRATRSLFRGDHFRFFVADKNLLEVRPPVGAKAGRQAPEQWLAMSSRRPDPGLSGRQVGR
jgi:GntR family transcriptional regulator